MSHAMLPAALISLCALFMAERGGFAEVLSQGSEFKMNGKFTGKKKDADSGVPASNLSGGACMPAKADGSRACLFIDDETRHAQFATLRGADIDVGAVIKLIDKEENPGVLGQPPEIEGMDAEAGFSEMDGEAVAYAEPYFYVAGSHGFTRKKNRFSLASFMLARIRVDKDGIPAGNNGAVLPPERWKEAVTVTYRLGDILGHAEGISDYFGKDLDEDNGLNLEGLVVADGRLIAGLRAPGEGKDAYLVAAEVEPLFAPGNERASGAAEVIPVPLGKQTGIRDLAALPDGRLLILAGPVQEQLVPYRLFLAEAKPDAEPVHLADIETPETEDGERSRAEALVPLSQKGAELRLLVLFDGLPNGGAREITVTLPDS